MTPDLIELLWSHRNAKIAGPWQHKQHPAGDSRGVWYRLDLQGKEVAWLEAPDQIPTRGDAAWPSLVADKKKQDARLEQQGYTLVGEEV